MRPAWPLLLLTLLSTISLAATPVTTRPLSELGYYPEHRAPASCEALNQPQLSAQISARVEAIEVRVGDTVQAGQRLLRLDCREYQSQLSQQQALLSQLLAQRRFAESQLERAQNLKQARSISEEQLQQRQTELASAQAQIRSQQQLISQAELRVERCQIRAPFAASVVARLASVGQLATPGTPLLQLVQRDAAELSAELLESQVDSLAAADKPRFRYQSTDYPLRLRTLLPLVDNRRRTRQARFDFSAETPPAGAAGQLLWNDPRLHVAAEYPVRRDGQLGLFVLDDGKARWVPLTDAVAGQPAAVELPGDTRIIVDGRQSLNDGDAVQLAD